MAKKRALSTPPTPNPTHDKPISGKRKPGHEIEEIFSAKKKKKSDPQRTDPTIQGTDAEQKKMKTTKEKTKKTKKSKTSFKGDGLIDPPSRSRRRTQDGVDIHTTEELGLGKSDSGGFGMTARRRGPTRCLALLGRLEGDRVHVRHNAEGQPIGPEAQTLSSYLGTLVRNGEHLSLLFEDWRMVTEEERKRIWEAVLKKFVLHDGLKDYVMRNVNKKWRDWKAALKRDHYSKYDNDAQRISEFKEKRVKIEDWRNLVAYWSSPDAQERSERNSANRSKQKFTHTGGTKAFARLREEKKIVEGRDPSRTAMFVATHTRKDGNPMDAATADIIAQLQEHASQLPKSSQGIVSKDDFVSQVLGPDRRGRVRTLGLGPSPTHLFGASSSRPATLRIDSQSADEVRELRGEVNVLRGQLAEMDVLKAQVADLLAAMTTIQRAGARPEPSMRAEAPDQDSDHRCSLHGHQQSSAASRHDSTSPEV